MFLYERVLDRLAASPYRDNFVLKGGLLISSMIGMSERTTMDMDTTVRGLPMEEDEIVANLIFLSTGKSFPRHGIMHRTMYAISAYLI